MKGSEKSLEGRQGEKCSRLGGVGSRTGDSSCPDSSAWREWTLADGTAGF